MKFNLIIFVLINLNLTAQHLVPFNYNGKYGLCDIEGKLLLEPKYDETRFFSAKTDGYAIKENGKYGLMNKDLKLVIPFISINPISESNKGYLVYITENEVHYYSKTYQLIQKKTLENRSGNYSPPEIVKDEEISDSYSNEKVLDLFNKKYPGKSKINVVSANNTYYELCSKTDEGKCKPLGVFLPKISVFLLNDEKAVYKNVTWSPGISKYIILVENGSEKYVIDQDKKVIFPAKEYERIYIQKSYIGYKDKNSNSKKSITHYHIVSSGVSIENKFSSFNPAKTLTIDGKFEVFRATINNYKSHKSDDVYIGENGKSYFKVDYEFDN